MLLGLIVLFSSAPKWDAYDVNRVTTHRIHRLESPTSILATNDTLYAVADIEDPRPGLYRLDLTKGLGYEASLLRIVPRQDLNGLSKFGKDQLVLTSSREFSSDPKQWVGHWITLDHERYLLQDQDASPISCVCIDKKHHCGMIGSIWLDEDRVLAVTGQQPARLIILKRQSRVTWVTEHSWRLRYIRRSVVISDVKLINDQLVFLIKNRWVLASLPLKRINDMSGRNLELNPAFDFSAIKPLSKITGVRPFNKGLAEGFTIDSAGRLMIVLNNRGYAFRGKRELHLDRPRLLVFEPKP